MTRVLLLTALAITLVAPTTAEALTFRQAKQQIRNLINDRYNVNRGPYVFACRGSSLYVRCDVEFRAGVLWRCGRGTVRESGGYWYTRVNAPIC